MRTITLLTAVLFLAARDPDRRRVVAARGGRTRGANARGDLTELAALRAETMAEYIGRKLAEAPPLTEAQRAKLARLLTSVPQDDVA